MLRRMLGALGIAGGMLWGAWAWAIEPLPPINLPAGVTLNSLTAPVVFKNGTPANANEINSNMELLRQKINELTTQVNTLSTGIQGGIGEVAESYTNDFMQLNGAIIPWDNSVPQITEGAEIARVTLTPKSPNSQLMIHAKVHMVERTNVADQMVVAIFRNSEPNAIASHVGAAQDDTYSNLHGVFHTIYVHHVLTVASTASITIKLRAGLNADGSVNINGGNQSYPKLGGSLQSGLTVIEVLPNDFVAPANSAVVSFSPRSCLEARNQGVFNQQGSLGSGVYTLNPTQTQGGNQSFYCDMTSEGGGWTLLMTRDNASTGNWTDESSFGANLSDPNANALNIYKGDWSDLKFDMVKYDLNDYTSVYYLPNINTNYLRSYAKTSIFIGRNQQVYRPACSQTLGGAIDANCGGTTSDQRGWVGNPFSSNYCWIGSSVVNGAGACNGAGGKKGRIWVR